MTAIWILLLALIIFFMYVWNGSLGGSSSGGSSCNACAKKNNPAVE
jgi:hypothetical protein